MLETTNPRLQQRGACRQLSSQCPAMTAPHWAGAHLPCFQGNLLRWNNSIDVMVCRIPCSVELDYHLQLHSQEGTHHIWYSTTADALFLGSFDVDVLIPDVDHQYENCNPLQAPSTRLSTRHFLVWKVFEDFAGQFRCSLYWRRPCWLLNALPCVQIWLMSCARLQQTL